jgi:hypothetical protein
MKQSSLHACSFCKPGSAREIFKAFRTLCFLALWVAGNTGHGQPGGGVLNLNTNPSFVFGTNTGADLLFAPGLLGITGGQPAYASVEALYAFAGQVNEVFPPGLEVFLAYWGNPGYGPLSGTAQSILPLTAPTPLGLAVDFLPPEIGSTVIGGRLDSFSYNPSYAFNPFDRSSYNYVNEVSVGNTIYYLEGGNVIVSPLVLDLDGNGVLGASGGVWQPHPSTLTGPYAAFDIDGDGFADVTEWVGPGDGLLCTTPTPSSGQDLLGTAGGWQDGFEHLAALFDLDDNGLVEGPELNGLYVWRDLNGNGVADAGEVVSVQSLGIAWISTGQTNYESSFGYSNGTSGLVWDWWPNYALANTLSATTNGGGLLGQGTVASLSSIAFPATNPVSTLPILSAQINISTQQLAAAGIDLGSFRVALLVDGGTAVLGYDQTGTPSRVRLLRIALGANAGTISVASLVLPFERLFQIAAEPTGNQVLVLGNRGAELVLADFGSLSLAPADGLDLRSISLRASGVAGYAGGFWFTAWQLDTNGAVVEERVWTLTPSGFLGGLSLDGLRAEFGDLRTFYLTGSNSGFFAVPTQGASDETLWWINGTNQVQVAQATNFGGMAATAGLLAYTKRDAGVYSFVVWKTNGVSITVATNSEPYTYPFLTPSGGTAIAATLSLASQSLTYWAAESPAYQGLQELLTAFPGQGKVAHGAFAHYGVDGIELIPVADVTPAPLLLNPQASGANFQFSFASQTGSLYVVESCANLPAGAWQPRTNIIGDDTLKTVQLPISTLPAEFFRVQAQ